MTHAPPPRSPVPLRAATQAVVRVVAVGDTRRNARAYATSTGPGYETLFTRPLVVRIVGKSNGTVRFSCDQPACRFAVSDQPNEVRRVDTRSYDVDLKDGRAELTLTLATDTVPGRYTIRARPVDHKRVLAGSRVTFDVTVE